MKRLNQGLAVGAVAGAIDVFPMLAQKLPWQADFSAFCFWVVVGAVTATSTLDFKPIPKGIAIACALLVPMAPVIGSDHPATLIPVTIMTLVLGAGVGWVLGRR